MMRTKDVYYRNTTYKVQLENLKHINGYDVVKLPNDSYIYYEDTEQKWKIAPNNLIEEYTGRRYIDVDINGTLIKSMSNIDLEESIYDKKVTKVNIEYIVIYDELDKIWKVLDKNSEIYSEYLKTIK